MADDYRLYMYACIVTVYGSQCKSLLLYLGQVTQYVFRFFSIQLGIQFHVIDSSEPEYCQLVVGIEASFQFKLCVGESWQER